MNKCVFKPRVLDQRGLRHSIVFIVSASHGHAGPDYLLLSTHYFLKARLEQLILVLCGGGAYFCVGGG